MRADAATSGDIERMQAWAGQSAGLGEDGDASEKKLNACGLMLRK